MANGIITLTRSSGVYLEGRIVWSSESNGTAANTSAVTATLQLQRAAKNTTTGTFRGSFTVGGTSESISWYGALPSYTWVSIKTITVTVSHSADGAGSCYVYAKINGPAGTTMEGACVSGSATVALDAIARFATLLSAPDFHDEENPTITFHNPAGATVDSLQACISLTGANADIAYRSLEKTGTGYTFSLTEAERNILRAATTGSNSRSVLFVVRTTIGGAAGTSSLRRTFQIKDPTPIISPVITDSNTVTAALTGDSSKLIRFYSNAAVTIGAAAVKQAALTRKKVTCGSKQLTADGIISAVESGSFAFSATDNRGNTTVKTVTVPFVNYIKLTCDLASNIPDTEGNMTVKATGNYYNGSFGAKNNSLQVYYRYKAYGGTYGAWKAMSVTIGSNTYAAAANVTGLDYQTAYVFQTYAADVLGTVYSAERTVKATPVFDWSKTDFAFHVPVSLGSGATATLLTAADDLDAVKNNGWYVWRSDSVPANVPAELLHYATGVRVWTSTGLVCCQEVMDMSDSANHGVLVRRTIYGNTVYPWEWENPPLIDGTEYRTTQRWRGKPVYVKLVDCGNLPNATSKAVNYQTSGVVAEAFDYCGSFDGQAVANAHPDFSLVVNKTQIIVATRSDLSASTLRIAVKYIKTADGI